MTKVKIEKKKFKIETDLPVVRRTRKDGEVRRKYPFPDMKVGDSLLDKGVKTTHTSKIRMAAVAWGKANGRQFTSRTVKAGVRVWRTG